MELRPAAEAADELRLQRVVRRLTVVIPDADVGVAEHAELPEVGVRRRGDHILAPIVDAVVIDVAAEHLIGDARLQQVVSVIGDVACFDRRAAPQLVLKHRVPLPIVRRPLIHFAPARGRAERGPKAAVARFGGRIELSNAAQRFDERRVRRDAEHGTEPLAQEELSDASPQRRLSRAGDIPGHTNPWRDVVQILLHQRAVRSVRPALRARLLAPVRPWRLQKAVAGIGAERRIEQRRHEARDLVVDGVRIEEQGVAHAVIERHAARGLPRIGGVHLDVAPALRRRSAGRRFREAPRHVFQQEVREHVARVRPPSVETRGSPEPRVHV